MNGPVAVRDTMVSPRDGARIVRRALALKREGIFRLLVLLTAVLGWVVALGSGGAVMLQQVYTDWSLARQQTVTVYLPSDSDRTEVATLMAGLATEPGIIQVNQVPGNELRTMLAPYGGLTEALPVPVVLDVQAAPDFSRAVLEQRVKALFATAETDDARALLASVAKGVRLSQLTGAGVALLVVVVMLAVVALTVRVGLKSQQATLALLRQLGASDRRLIGMVVAQVGERVLTGWALALTAAMLGLAGALVWWPVLQPMVTWPVWLVLLAAPLTLPLGALLTAALTTRAQLRQLV